MMESKTKRKCSRKFDRIFKTGSLRSKVFKFMNDYPHSTLTQATNYFQEEYRPFIANIDDFKNMVHVYRTQYWDQHGKPYTPPKDQLQQIRKEYKIPLYPPEFTPDPEVVATKIIEKEESNIDRLNSIRYALQSFRS